MGGAPCFRIRQEGGPTFVTSMLQFIYVNSIGNLEDTVANMLY